MMLSIVTTLQGCSSDSTEDSNNPTAIELRLKGDIAMVKTRVNANGFEASDKVGVYVSATGSLAQKNNTLDNEAFTFADGNLATPEGKEVYWGTENVRLSVWAYYPYDEEIENNSAYAFAVNENQSSEEDFYNSDFIIATATNLPPQTTPVVLTFNHALSKIAITLKAGEGITTEELAAATKTFSILNLGTEGTINLATGIATVSTTTATVTPHSTDGLNYAAIVYPQNGSTTFRMEMDGDNYTYSTNVEYQAGYQYKYTLTINKCEPKEMSLTIATITPWNEGSTFEGDMTLESDIIQFKDPAFKTAVINSSIYEIREEIKLDSTSDPSYSNGIITSEYRYIETSDKVDANRDGEISFEEASKATYLELALTDIFSLDDVKYFPNLRYLGFRSTDITEVDFTNNKNLEFINCKYSQISSLDLSNNQKLLRLDCNNTQLTSLDLANNTLLETLWMPSTQITSLNVSECKALEYLECWNSQLSTLNVSGCTALEFLGCWNNQLSTLNASGCTALEYLGCGVNQLSSLNVSGCTTLRIFHCEGNQLTSLNVSECTALEKLFCKGNQLTTLDVSHNKALQIFNCDENQLTELDVSQNLALSTLLSCRDNQLTSLDISKNTLLIELWCGNNQFTELDVSNNSSLRKLHCAEFLHPYNGILQTIYMAESQTIDSLTKPEDVVIEYI